ncbi:MAG: V-type ATP synthase subunit D [Anaerolineales bacterium]|nr:V-type ATP synthase subunit D [Anaerolineales bacterium]
MASLSATRMELLAKKAHLALAEQGQDLLEQKRLALLRELLSVVDRVVAGREQLQAAALAARRALARAEAFAGGEAVRSAALAARADLPIQVQTANVMGVSVPTIERKRVDRSLLGRGYALTGTPVTIDEAAGAFEAEVNQLLELAESELRLTRLAAEIQRTSRRANALEYVLIPRLAAERDAIALALDERERADHFRLKRVKQVLERRRPADER